TFTYAAGGGAGLRPGARRSRACYLPSRRGGAAGEGHPAGRGRVGDDGQRGSGLPRHAQRYRGGEAARDRGATGWGERERGVRDQRLYRARRAGAAGQPNQPVDDGWWVLGRGCDGGGPRGGADRARDGWGRLHPSTRGLLWAGGTQAGARYLSGWLQPFRPWLPCRLLREHAQGLSADRYPTVGPAGGLYESAVPPPFPGRFCDRRGHRRGHGAVDQRGIRGGGPPGTATL